MCSLRLISQIQQVCMSARQISSSRERVFSPQIVILSTYCETMPLKLSSQQKTLGTIILQRQLLEPYTTMS